MGRNKKSIEEKCSKVLKANVTEKEYNLALKKGSELGFTTIADYIKFCALSKDRTINIMPEINEKYFSELKRVGVNINQIAFQLNNKLLPKEGELMTLFKQIQEQNLYLIEELRKQYKKSQQRFGEGNKE